MEIIFNHNFYVMNLDHTIDYELYENKILQKIDACNNSFFSKKMAGINRNKDWSIEFEVIYNNVSQVYICKEKEQIEEEKIIIYTIHVPVPKRQDVSWGLEKKNFISNSFVDRINTNNKFISIPDIDTSNFENLNDYLVECVYCAVKKIIEAL